MPPRKRKPDAEAASSEAASEPEVPVVKKQPKTKYRSQKSSNLWKLAGSVPIAILFYGGFASYRFYQIMYPTFELEDNRGNVISTYTNKVVPGQNLVCEIYIGETFDINKPSDYKIPFKYEWEDKAFGEIFDKEIEVPKSMIDQNKNILLTAVVFDERGRAVTHAQSKMIKYIKPPKEIPTYHLYNGVQCPVEREPLSNMNKNPRGIPQMKLRLVFDETKYPQPYRREDYNPVMFVDEFWLTNDQLVPMNNTDVNRFNTTVHFDLMSSARWNFQSHMERSLQTNAEMFGEDAEEVLQMRDLFANTNGTLLVATMVVSILHMIFEYLAFKNDVEFWRKTKPEELTKYMSVRSVLGGIGCQIVILTYLWDQSANLLVAVTSLIAILIDCWKIQRVMKWTIVWIFGIVPIPWWCQRFGESNDQKHDAQATFWVCLACTPVAFVYGFYALYWECHKGWYSYILSTTTSLVYALGFAFMTPQLFINYRLKSVAHLPWRRFVYRAINTFIDDLFSFIIRMPTMHRMSCFRDDIIFFVYLYQRWIYKVDKSRAFDEDGNPVEDFQEEEDGHVKAE